MTKTPKEKKVKTEFIVDYHPDAQPEKKYNQWVRQFIHFETTNISCGVVVMWNVCVIAEPGGNRELQTKKIIRRVFPGRHLMCHPVARRMFPSISKGTKQFAVVVFSDTVTNGCGEYVASFIEKNGLGRVSRSEPALNPNSGNSIVVYSWAVDWDAMDKWDEVNPEYEGE